MKRLIIGIVTLLLVIRAVMALCLGASCAITGNLSQLYPANYASVRVVYQYGQVQSVSGVIIPGGASCSVTTDASGNLPTTGNCSSFVQGATMFVTVGSGQPVQIQIPLQSTADLSILIQANTTQDPLISALAVLGGIFAGCTVTNPAAGGIGTSTITCPSPVTFTTSGVLNAGQQLVRCDATAGAVTLTLPISTAGGSVITIFKVDSSANACNVLPNSGGPDQIWGSSLSLVLSQQFAIVTVSDYKLGVWSEAAIPPVVSGPSGSYVTHYNTAQTVVPVVSSCGTGAAVSVGSSDAAGYVVVGSTNPTLSCTITFKLPYVGPTPPTCICGINNGTQQMCNPNTTINSMVISFASDVHGQTVQWMCKGNGN